MHSRRWRILAAATCIATLAAPSVFADLSVSVDTSSGFDIYADGAKNLSAPGNMTIVPVTYGNHDAFRLSWSTPNLLPGQQVTGYTVYRVPGPDSPGSTISVDVSASTTSVVDHWAQDNTFVYFVTATISGIGESVPSHPVTTEDVATPMQPKCGVVSVYTTPPYYSVQLSCLFTT